MQKYVLEPEYMGADCQTYRILLVTGEGRHEVVPSASLEITVGDDGLDGAVVAARVTVGMASAECDVCEAGDVIESMLDGYVGGD